MEKKLTIVTSVFQGEKYLKKFLENMMNLNNKDECQLILVVNEATDGEKRIIDPYTRMDQDFIIPHYLDFRETIGSSTNRGYQLADTEYLAYTDVDDTRPADAFVELLQTLEKNPDIDFTYGNFLVVPKQGATKGQMIETIEFDRNEFTRGSHVGPGHCFRRSLLKQCGYWDEQLRSGGDFDFQIRAAVHGKFKKTYKNVAYYTSDQTQSASSTSWQAIDALTICLRYGIYDKLAFYLSYLPETSNYRINEILQQGEWYSISEFIPDYMNFLSDRRDLISKSMKGMSFKWTKDQIDSFVFSGLEKMHLLNLLKSSRDRVRKFRETG